MSTAPTFQFANFSDAQPLLSHLPVHIWQPEDWFDQPTARKPPCSVPAARQMFLERSASSVPATHTARSLDVERLLNVNILDTAMVAATATAAARDLDQIYVFENRPEVTAFIEAHRLHGLLRQASTPLRRNFGEESLKTLLIVADDEGFETLFCVVVTSGDLRHNRQALRDFDREWWLSHARQAAGRLNFDFKLI